jgi:hypothetical protein
MDKFKIPFKKTKSKKSYKTYKKDWISLITHMGMNYCKKCGYNKCFAAIEFHHMNKNDKLIAISKFFNSPISKDGIDELAKCIPLCANCHRELHYMESE